MIAGGEREFTYCAATLSSATLSMARHRRQKSPAFKQSLKLAINK